MKFIYKYANQENRLVDASEITSRYFALVVILLSRDVIGKKNDKRSTAILHHLFISLGQEFFMMVFIYEVLGILSHVLEDHASWW